MLYEEAKTLDGHMRDIGGGNFSKGVRRAAAEKNA